MSRPDPFASTLTLDERAQMREQMIATWARHNGGFVPYRRPVSSLERRRALLERAIDDAIAALDALDAEAEDLEDEADLEPALGWGEGDVYCGDGYSPDELNEWAVDPEPQDETWVEV